MRHLQQLSSEYKDQGIVILGINTADERRIAQEFLADNLATFPTILDASETAQRVAFEDYRACGVPVNYIVDRGGKVIDAWYGYERGHGRAKAALKKAGLE